MDYEIIDNFLPKSKLKVIKNIVSDNQFPWLCVEKKIINDDSNKKYCIFDHPIYSHNVPVSPYFDDISPILEKIECKSLLSMYFNMFVCDSNIAEFNIKPEYPFPNTKAILFLNNNDGYTILKDGVEIENIENRLIIFNGMSEYNDSNCTNNYRKLTMSFNYI